MELSLPSLRHDGKCTEPGHSALLSANVYCPCRGSSICSLPLCAACVARHIFRLRYRLTKDGNGNVIRIRDQAHYKLWERILKLLKSELRAERLELPKDERVSLQLPTDEGEVLKLVEARLDIA